MDAIEKIFQIVTANYQEEMDSWDFGPFQEIIALAKGLTEKEWQRLIELTKAEKPDMWRVMLSHAFVEHRVGLSEQLATFQAAKCVSPREAYFIVQYMGGFSWASQPRWLLLLFKARLEQLITGSEQRFKAYLYQLHGAVSAAAGT